MKSPSRSSTSPTENSFAPALSIAPFVKIARDDPRVCKRQSIPLPHSLSASVTLPRTENFPASGAFQPITAASFGDGCTATVFAGNLIVRKSICFSVVFTVSEGLSLPAGAHAISPFLSRRFGTARVNSAISPKPRYSIHASTTVRSSSPTCFDFAARKYSAALAIAFVASALICLSFVDSTSFSNATIFSSRALRLAISSLDANGIRNVADPAVLAPGFGRIRLLKKIPARE